MIYQEPGPGCVLVWFARFQRGGRQYQYAAVHIEGKGWYTTDTIHPNPITWDALRVRIGSSRCFAVSGWAEIPHALEGQTVTHALPPGRGEVALDGPASIRRLDAAEVARIEDALDNPNVMSIFPGDPRTNWR